MTKDPRPSSTSFTRLSCLAVLLASCSTGAIGDPADFGDPETDGGTPIARPSTGGRGGSAGAAGQGGAPGGAQAGATGTGGKAGATGSGGAAGAPTPPTGGGGGIAGPISNPPPVMPPPANTKGSVIVRLQRTAAGGKTIVFGVPFPPGAVPDAAGVRILAGGAPIAGAAVKVLLREYDKAGAAKGVRALQVQLPMAAMTGQTLDVEIVFRGTGPAPAAATAVYSSADLSVASPETIATATRTIQASGGVNRLVEGASTTKTMFMGREPFAVPVFPAGYLASTRLLGEQIGAEQAKRPELAGLSFFSQAAGDFGLSAMYAANYPVNPASVVDPLSNFEGWLYDRCATFLTFYGHHGDVRFLRHALRSCAWYAGQITLSGANIGIFKGKPDPDQKYSHLRGLFAYYALTGDEAAFEAGKAIADMWEQDKLFVGPYRAGKLRGTDKIWTERLLGTSLEGLMYGHWLTGDPKYLTATREMVATAHKHVTGDGPALAALNPGVGPFPPQNCFIHSALQAAEGEAAEPWCSGWMTELTVDALLRYQEQTADERVDEIFIRLTRFLRDVGSQYLVKANPQNDTFMKPKSCYRAADGPSARVLAPLYGGGLLPNGTRANYGDGADLEHCADATAMSAAGLRALKRRGAYDANPIGPFKSEGESFLALHHELAFCAKINFQDWARPDRDPATWTSAELAAGLSNPAAFIETKKIGYPTHLTTPQRKVSWWFNVSMLQFGLLADAGIGVPQLAPGQIQPAGCK